MNDALATLKYLKKYADKVVVLGPSMQYSQALPRLLIELDPGKDNTKIYQKAGRYKFFKKLDQVMKSLFEKTGVVYISTLQALCNEQGCVTVTPEGVPVSFDEGHLTYEGAKLILEKTGRKIFGHD